MTTNTRNKAAFLHCFDKVTKALNQLDELGECDTMILVPLLAEFHKASVPLVESMRPKSRKKSVKRFGLSDMQCAVLERFRVSGSVSIYQGYRKFIRTADSLDKKGLVERDIHAIGLSSTNHYNLTDAGRAMLDKLAQA